MLRCFLFLLFPNYLLAQFSPAAGLSGSTAIANDSSIFINWAKNVKVVRGKQHITVDSSEFAGNGIPEAAIGKADKQSVSLGDSGYAILHFDPPIINGEGFDFAVFENGFATTGGYFLELAFVEVSSDGINFVRFPAISLTDTSRQLGTFDLIDPTKIHNLAGKYVAGHGTPFDLEELAEVPDLDIQNINCIKVIDVIGSLTDSIASYDAHGNKINDPFPTPFHSGGFDLDAIGVIHQKAITNINDFEQQTFAKVFPNPLNIQEPLNIKMNTSYPTGQNIQLFDLYGKLLLEKKIESMHTQLLLAGLLPGIYWLKIEKKGQLNIKKIIIHDKR